MQQSIFRSDFLTSIFFKIMIAALFLSSGLMFSGMAHAHEERLWKKLKSGGEYIVLMRHAYAPGMGDPQHFKLNDCSTQRVLDETGRQQAMRIGDRFRANGIEAATVYSSPWCRCFDRTNHKP